MKLSKTKTKKKKKKEEATDIVVVAELDNGNSVISNQTSRVLAQIEEYKNVELYKNEKLIEGARKAFDRLIEISQQTEDIGTSRKACLDIISLLGMGPITKSKSVVDINVTGGLTANNAPVAITSPAGYQDVLDTLSDEELEALYEEHIGKGKQ